MYVFSSDVRYYQCSFPEKASEYVLDLPRGNVIHMLEEAFPGLVINMEETKGTTQFTFQSTKGSRELIQKHLPVTHDSSRILKGQLGIPPGAVGYCFPKCGPEMSSRHHHCWELLRSQTPDPLLDLHFNKTPRVSQNVAICEAML